MSEISPFLKHLISLPGLSGFEEPVRTVIENQWRPLVDELSVSNLGSLHGLRHSESKKDSPSILVATHMDAIGLMVTGITDGFLHVTSIGGVDPRVLPGQAVVVHGRRDLPGIATLLADRLVNSNHKNAPAKLERILIDVGLHPKDVGKLVQIGDLVSFATQPVDLADNALAGHSLDNRASVAALTSCLEDLRKVKLDWNVWAVATIQEEVTLGGAATSTFSIRPDLAVVLDVTFAKGPGASDYRTFPLGKGITIGVGSNIHPILAKKFREVADEIEVPYVIETMPISSGTDAIAVQTVAEGIPCAVIEIPIRYMHTPVEVASITDIKRAGRLLASFISRLDENTLGEMNKEMLQ